MYYIPMRIRILIVVAVLLTPLAVWRIVSSRNSAPDRSPEEIAIRKDRIAGNVEGLAKKVKTFPPKYARKAVRAFGPGGAKSLPLLKKVLLEDKRSEIRQQAAQTMAQAVQVAARKDKPLARQMTSALVTALSRDKTPEVRASAAAALGQVYDYNNMASLLKAMDDKDLTVRRRAFEAVTRIFGRRYIFNPNSAPDKRQIVIRAINADWEIHKKPVGNYHDRNRKSLKQTH